MELLVSMGIIAIVSAVVFVGYRDAGERTFIQDQANMALSGIEEARSAALSATQMTKDGDRVSEFTIHFEEDHFILFKGTDKENRRNFEGAVAVEEGVGKGIGFIPPEPEIIFFDSGGDLIEDEPHVDIVLRSTGEDSEIIKVRTNRVGLVQVGREFEREEQ